MKQSLRSLIPEEYNLYTVNEAIKVLGWQTEYPEGDERGTGKITCTCGMETYMGGFMQVDRVVCEHCQKQMMDVTGLQYYNGYVSYIDLDLYEYPEDNKVWITSL